MGLFKSNMPYPALLRILCLENVNWYNKLLEEDSDYPERIQDQMCLTYFNISIATYFLIHSNISTNNQLSVKYSVDDASQIFTDSLFVALTDYGYNDEQSQAFLDNFDLFIDQFNKYRSRFDEETLKTKDSNAHILKGCSADLIMNMLVAEELVNTDNYAEMNKSICQFINTIMIENMNAFNKSLKKYKITY